MSTDLAWLTEHGVELQRQYAGKWIAVRKGEVIGSGETAVEADQEAQQRAAEGDYILQAVESTADTIYGGI